MGLVLRKAGQCCQQLLRPEVMTREGWYRGAMGPARLRQEVFNPPSHPPVLRSSCWVCKARGRQCISSCVYLQLEVRSSASALGQTNAPPPQRSRCLSPSWNQQSWRCQLLPAALPALAPLECQEKSMVHPDLTCSNLSPFLPVEWLGALSSPSPPNILQRLKGRGQPPSGFPPPHPAAPTPSARTGVSLSTSRVRARRRTREQDLLIGPLCQYDGNCMGFGGRRLGIRILVPTHMLFDSGQVNWCRGPTKSQLPGPSVNRSRVI